MPSLTPPASYLAWVLEYFLHPTVLQSSQARVFPHDHRTGALLPFCSTLYLGSLSSVRSVFILVYTWSLTSVRISEFTLPVETMELNRLHACVSKNKTPLENGTVQQPGNSQKELRYASFLQWHGDRIFTSWSAEQIRCFYFLAVSMKH